MIARTLLSLLVCALAAQDPAPATANKATPQSGTGYQVLRSLPIGGDGGWDYVTVDADARRLYVSHATHTAVLDADSGKVVGDLPDTPGVHGVALASEFGRGFVTCGRANHVLVFDTKTLQTTKTLPAGKNPDALVYEPTTKSVFVGNHSSGDITVIAADKLEVRATIEVGGTLEFLVADGKGKVFVNVEDRSELACLDAKQHAVVARYPLAPGEEPTGLAIDAARGLLFAACSNGKLVVVDAATGKVLATPAIGGGADGAVCDAERGLVFTSNGEGSVTVVAIGGEHPFAVVQTVPTLRGARTLTLDPKTHTLLLPTARLGEPTGQSRRGAIEKDSFQLLVVGTAANATESK